MRTTTTGPELRFMQLDVYRVARDIVTRVVALGVKDAELASQVTRAAKSLLLNLAEGLPSRSAGMRRRFFATALGSAYEVAAAVDAAAALGAADRAAVNEVLALCDRVSARRRACRCAASMRRTRHEARMASSVVDRIRAALSGVPA